MHHPHAGRMNNRHLPAGQAMPGGQGGGGVSGGMEMGGPPNGGGGGGGGPRRRGHPSYPNHPHHSPHQSHHQHQHPHAAQHHFHQQMQPMYPAYNHYAPPFYPQMVAPPGAYQANGAMTPYTMAAHFHPNASPTYTRSPPAMQQFVPMNGVTVQPSYSGRQSQPSPALHTPYQPPPVPAVAAATAAVMSPAPVPGPSLTPSSTHSSQAMVPPPMSPPVEPPPPEQPLVMPLPVVIPAPIPAPVMLPLVEPEPVPVASVDPFRPPLPWLSCPGEPFPSKVSKSRRKRRVLADTDELVMPPVDQHDATPEPSGEVEAKREPLEAAVSTPTPAVAQPALAAGPRSETPSTQDLPSEDTSSTSPTTPSSVHQRRSSTTASVTPTAVPKLATRAAVPAVPIVPAVPKSAPKGSVERPQVEEKQPIPVSETAPVAVEVDDASATPAEDAAAAVSQPQQAKPRLWTGLFAQSAAASKPAAGPNGTAAPPAPSAGESSAMVAQAADGSTPPTLMRSGASSLAEALRSYRVGAADKVSFIEPRGLINTGNMCYMNSVLQVLLFCVPFYDFLDQVYKKATHSFKSETPLIDAMVMFMKEFRVIDAATSVDQLRRRLKSEELEQYGEAFTPDFVYEAIRKLPRFASMRRGHQQDAEEFLGFLLQSLDDECTRVMGGGSGNASSQALQSGSASSADPTDDWLEVGRKQRAAVTRSSGASSSSPITRIFGGTVRSELRVPRLKDSITTEPFQPLQLDIGAPEVRNIVDALKGITKIETLHGDFGSPLGKDGRATKQVFIESLPPVLILHLKRFQFDAEGNGTVKIWKKVGYPLELEIPREVFSRQKRNSMVDGGAPRYRLIAVVYHHGKNASGGHYTVDVRRQDDREWIRLDDTVIRRVRSEDVAEAGAEDKEPVSTPSGGSSTRESSTNRFGTMMEEEEGSTEDGWKQVSGGVVNGNKRWSSVVNGSGSATKSKQVKEGVKDNKVAYLLFYQRI